MRVITITEKGSRYCVSDPTGPSPRSRVGYNTNLWDAGNAAADALKWALSESTPYVIVGADKAMAHIPAAVRTRT